MCAMQIAGSLPLHCVITRRGNSSASITDNSANGTYVNGQRVGKGHVTELAHGDTITFVVPDASVADSAYPDFVCYSFVAVRQAQAPESPFARKYIKGEKLGEGGFAEVWSCVERATSTSYAVKILNKRRLTASAVSRSMESECRLMATIRHPNVVQVVEVLDSDDELCIFCAAVICWTPISKRGSFSESDARDCFAVILNAIAFLHTKNIVHRDLKPDNILLSDSNDLRSVKLTDFGLARTYGSSEGMKTICGTPQYTAPEVLLDHATGYTRAVDCWSAGVLLYCMLCGFYPFYDEPGRPLAVSMRQYIASGQLPNWDRVCKNVSPEAKDLVLKLLTPQPAKRITAKKALEHPWFKASLNGSSVHQLQSPMRLQTTLKGASTDSGSATNGQALLGVPSRVSVVMGDAEGATSLAVGSDLDDASTSTSAGAAGPSSAARAALSRKTPNVSAVTRASKRLAIDSRVES